jgi:hypothetical protein
MRFICSRFQVLTAVLMNISVLWNVMLCHLVHNHLPVYTANYPRSLESSEMYDIKVKVTNIIPCVELHSAVLKLLTC